VNITTTETLQPGTRITILGCGLSARGLPVVNGRFVHNGRKAKVKTLTVFVVQQSVTAGAGKRRALRG
jgi:hypothetical protein